MKKILPIGQFCSRGIDVIDVLYCASWDGFDVDSSLVEVEQDLLFVA